MFSVDANYWKWSYVMKKHVKLALLLTPLVLGTSMAAAESVSYKGTGTYLATRSVLPLAGGGAVISNKSTASATIEPSEVGFLFGECMGLGLLSAEGSAADLDFYCTFRESSIDGFDIKGTGAGDSAKTEVVGGRGKWQGATGQGTIKRRAERGDRGTFVYEVTISTP